MPQRTILIVAAHPDDEILGVGGTARLHAEKGDIVRVLILGEGAMSRDGSGQQDTSGLRRQAEEAGRLLGYQVPSFVSLPDNAFDTVGLLRIAKEVEKAIEEIKPDRVYTHHACDLNVDHRLTFEAVLTACRPCNPHAPAEIFTFETLSSTEWQDKQAEPFQPNAYIDIETSIEKKIEAMKAYASEMRPYPHPRSPEGIRILAQYRGLEAGLRFAEAFHIVRTVVREGV